MTAKIKMFGRRPDVADTKHLPPWESPAKEHVGLVNCWDGWLVLCCGVVSALIMVGLVTWGAVVLFKMLGLA